MADDQYYDVFINEVTVATVGPSSLKQLHISFGVTDGAPVVKAGGVSEKDGGLMYINWLEETVNISDTINVIPSKKNTATKPLITKKLGRGEENTEEESFCDFCNRTEEEAGKLTRLGDSPQICAKCVRLCIERIES